MMQILLSQNGTKLYNWSFKMGHNLVPRRHSRNSVEKHRVLMRLKRQYLVDKTPAKCVPTFESPISLIDQKSGKYKTSITVDILGRETFPQLTEWRKTQLVKRSRRLLPLPVSLTGLGDGEMPHFWSHVMKKASFRLKRRLEMSEMGLFETIPVSLRMFIENFGDKVQKDWPEVYHIYLKSKQLSQNKVNNKLVSNNDKVLQFPYELVSYLKEKQSVIKKESNEELDSPRLQSGQIDTEYKEYLKHHHLMQYLAKSLTIKTDEYEAEIEGWRDQFWLRYD